MKSLFETGREAGRAAKLEILVQDDATPGLDLTKFLSPPVKAARNERNLGFAGNCNTAALRAQGEALLFLNQDTVAQPGWFEPLLAAFARPEVGIVGPKLLFPAESDVVPMIQSCGGLYDASRQPYHRHLGALSDWWVVNEGQRVSWTTGAALAIRRDVFLAVDGFSRDYPPAYFEDVDLCEKVKAKGYEIWYEPAAAFTHKVGSTGGIPAELFRRNALRFRDRWAKDIKPDAAVRHVDYY